MPSAARKDVENVPPDDNKLGRWVGAQATNIEPTRRAAAQHIISRWDVTSPWFSMPKTLRSLAREESEHLLGAQLIMADFADMFGQEAGELGIVGGVPLEVTRCVDCRREAVPGADRCGRHGGQFLTPEDAKRISNHTAQRIIAATDAAFRVTMELLDEGRSEMVRLQAANSIFDRAGLSGVQKIEIGVDTAGQDAIEILRERLKETQLSMTKVEEIEAHRVEPGSPEGEGDDVVEATVED